MDTNWKLCPEVMCSDFYYQRLHTLRQLSTVHCYRNQFQLLQSLVSTTHPEVDEAYFASCCINGLKEEIRNVVQLFRPVTVSHVLSLAGFQELVIENKAKTTTSNDGSSPNDLIAGLSQATEGISADKLLNEVNVDTGTQCVSNVPVDTYALASLSIDLPSRCEILDQNLDVTDDVEDKVHVNDLIEGKLSSGSKDLSNIAKPSVSAATLKNDSKGPLDAPESEHPPVATLGNIHEVLEVLIKSVIPMPIYGIFIRFAYLRNKHSVGYFLYVALHGGSNNLVVHILKILRLLLYDLSWRCTLVNQGPIPKVLHLGDKEFINPPRKPFMCDISNLYDQGELVPKGLIIATLIVTSRAVYYEQQCFAHVSEFNALPTDMDLVNTQMVWLQSAGVSLLQVWTVLMGVEDVLADNLCQLIALLIPLPFKEVEGAIINCSQTMVHGMSSLLGGVHLSALYFDPRIIYQNATSVDAAPSIAEMSTFADFASVQPSGHILEHLSMAPTLFPWIMSTTSPNILWQIAWDAPAATITNNSCFPFLKITYRHSYNDKESCVGAIIGVYRILLWLFNFLRGLFMEGTMTTADIAYADIFQVLARIGSCFVVSVKPDHVISGHSWLYCLVLESHKYSRHDYMVWSAWENRQVYLVHVNSDNSVNANHPMGWHSISNTSRLVQYMSMFKDYRGVDDTERMTIVFKVVGKAVLSGLTDWVKGSGRSNLSLTTCTVWAGLMYWLPLVYSCTTEESTIGPWIGVLGDVSFLYFSAIWMDTFSSVIFHDMIEKDSFMLSSFVKLLHPLHANQSMNTVFRNVSRLYSMRHNSTELISLKGSNNSAQRKFLLVLRYELYTDQGLLGLLYAGIIIGGGQLMLLTGPQILVCPQIIEDPLHLCSPLLITSSNFVTILTTQEERTLLFFIFNGDEVQFTIEMTSSRILGRLISFAYAILCGFEQKMKSVGFETSLAGGSLLLGRHSIDYGKQCMDCTSKVVVSNVTGKFAHIEWQIAWTAFPAIHCLQSSNDHDIKFFELRIIRTWQGRMYRQQEEHFAIDRMCVATVQFMLLTFQILVSLQGWPSPGNLQVVCVALALKAVVDMDTSYGVSTNFSYNLEVCYKSPYHGMRLLSFPNQADMIVIILAFAYGASLVLINTGHGMRQTSRGSFLEYYHYRELWLMMLYLFYILFWPNGSTLVTILWRIARATHLFLTALEDKDVFKE